MKGRYNHYKQGLMMKLTITIVLSTLSLLSYSQNLIDTSISKRINEKLIQAIQCEESVLTMDSIIKTLDLDVKALEAQIDSRGEAMEIIMVKHDVCQIESNHQLGEIMILEQSNEELTKAKRKWQLGSGGLALLLLIVLL